MYDCFTVVKDPHGIYQNGDILTRSHIVLLTRHNRQENDGLEFDDGARLFRLYQGRVFLLDDGWMRYTATFEYEPVGV